jgi:hypothetical protein
MGYADFANFKLVDGYQLNSVDGYSLTTNWVDVHSATNFDVSVVFTGGSPTGTVKLQKSNDLQWTGGNRPQPLSSANVSAVSDAVDAPTGSGTVSVSVSGAGVYTLNQSLVGYRWFRVVYTASGNANTQLDIFVNWKKL